MEHKLNFTASTSFCSFPVRATSKEEARRVAKVAIRALGWDEAAAETVDVEPRVYTTLDAIEYLWANQANGSEWQEAAMWHGVCKIMSAREERGMEVFDEAFLVGVIADAEAE